MSRQQKSQEDKDEQVRTVMIDTTQGAGEKAGLLSENGDRAHLLSAGGADEFQQSAMG